MVAVFARRSWVIVCLAVYVLAVAAIVLLPVSYASIIDGAHRLIESIGLTGFGSGWIEFAANIVMFVPLGLLLTLLFRHHWYGVALALALSVFVEIAQIVIPSRQPSLRDILANALGAAIGAAVAWLIVRREKERSSPRVES